MGTFLLRRLFSSLISVFGATIVVFFLIQLHNDPRELFVPDTGYGITQEQWDNLGERLGFNDPVVVQYLLWIGRAIRGDFGVSLAQQRPVTTIIKGKIGATIQLAVGGWLFAVLLGIPTGVIAAVYRGGIWDYVARGAAIIGIGAPAFVTGLILIIIFSTKLGWFPAGTRSLEFNVKDYVLPCVALGWPAAAGLMRLTRSAMLEVLDSEFVKLARAKGVPWRTVVFKHALRNALIAPLTSMLLLFSGWLNGALVIETVFSWPGIGFEALFTAVNDNDFPLLLGTVFIFILIFLTFAFIADVLYTIVDPRVRMSGYKGAA